MSGTWGMSGPTAAMVNAFVEDTCVITTLGFLLVRGSVLKWFHEPTRFWPVSGLLVGAIALSESIAPGARHPYEVHSFAMALGFSLLGTRAGAFGAALAALLSVGLLGGHDPAWFGILVSAVTAFAASHLRGDWWWRLPVIGAVTEIVGYFGKALTFPRWQPEVNPMYAFWANAFGMLVIGLVVREAVERSMNAELRTQRDESEKVSRQAQLAMLRARIHPHFLFNALNTIAALCQIDAKRAQKSTLRLSQLMRRALEHDPRQPVSIARELEYVQSYLEIEKERFGARLKVRFEMEGDETVSVPPFAVQSLVENAIIHGLSKRPKGGHVCIATRNRSGGVLVCVGDDGVGAEKGWKRSGEVHGMGILDDQLRMQFGQRSRLRFLSVSGRGTLVAFFIPHGREATE